MNSRAPNERLKHGGLHRDPQAFGTSIFFLNKWKQTKPFIHQLSLTHLKKASRRGNAAETLKKEKSDTRNENKGSPYAVASRVIPTCRQQECSQPSQLTFIKLASGIPEQDVAVQSTCPVATSEELAKWLSDLPHSHGKKWTCNLCPGYHLTPGPDHRPHVQIQGQEAQQTPSER